MSMDDRISDACKDYPCEPGTVIQGGLDEVVVFDATRVHLEQMDDGHWWLRIDRRDKPAIVVNLHTRRNAWIDGMAEVEP